MASLEQPVLVSDLEIVRAALTSAFSQHTALDLVEGYRNLNPAPKQSRMTVALERALGKVEMYISLSEEEDEDEQPVPE